MRSTAALPSGRPWVNAILPLGDNPIVGAGVAGFTELPAGVDAGVGVPPGTLGAVVADGAEQAATVAARTMNAMVDGSRTLSP
jgi:hypothetical protein